MATATQFSADVNYGGNYELQAVEYLEAKYEGDYRHVHVLPYAEYPDEQIAGRDIILTWKTGGETRFQVKSRKPGNPDFAFECALDDNSGRWILLHPKADNYIFYVPDVRKEPYIIPVTVFHDLFNKNYPRWSKKVYRNREGDGHCVYIAPHELCEEIIRFLWLFPMVEARAQELAKSKIAEWIE